MKKEELGKYKMYQIYGLIVNKQTMKVILSLYIKNKTLKDFEIN